jgi:hypothetical protein
MPPAFFRRATPVRALCIFLGCKEAVMLVDSAVTQAYLYIYSDMSYERESVNYQ